MKAFKRCKAAYDTADEPLPPVYLDHNKLMKYGEATKFSVLVCLKLKRRRAGVVSEKVLQTELTKELKIFRPLCDGDEKPFVSQPLLARVYKCLWGK